MFSFDRSFRDVSLLLDNLAISAPSLSLLNLAPNAADVANNAEPALTLINLPLGSVAGDYSAGISAHIWLRNVTLQGHVGSSGLLREGHWYESYGAVARLSAR